MFRYNRNMVLAAYRAAHPDNLEVSNQTLANFDAGLFARYDEELRNQAAQEGIPINDFNLSMLVFFAAQSSAKLVTTRVRHAVRFFRSVRPQP